MNMNIQPVTEESYESEEEELDFVKLMMMENQPWWKLKCFPFDAVDQEQIFKGRELDSPLIQVCCVESFDTLWVYPQDPEPCSVDKRDELSSSMTRFYTDGAGKEWGIPNSRGQHIKRMMACKLGDEFHRVLVVKILSGDVVNVFYLDYGNSGDVQVADLRLLHKDFLALPAQVVSVRLWGVQEPQGKAEGALKRLLEKLNDGNYYGFACTKVQVKEGPRRRWSGSMEENGSRPAVILQDIRDGKSIAHSLLMENQATLDMNDFKDYVDGKLEYLDTVAFVDESSIEHRRQLQIFIKEAWEASTIRIKKDFVVSRPKLRILSFGGRTKATIIDIEENNDSEDEEVLQSLRKVEDRVQVKTSRPKLRVIVGVGKVVFTPSTSDSVGNCPSYCPQQSRFAQDESFLEENNCCLGIRVSRPKLKKRDVVSPGSEDSGVYDDAEDNTSLSSLHIQKQRVCRFIKVGPCCAE